MTGYFENKVQVILKPILKLLAILKTKAQVILKPILNIDIPMDS